MFRITTTNGFEKDAVKCDKRGLKLDSLQEVINLLEKDGTVPAKYRPHTLSGKMHGFWECHVKADWLLIWIKNESQNTITLIGTGTHSDLF